MDNLHQYVTKDKVGFRRDILCGGGQVFVFLQGLIWKKSWGIYHWNTILQTSFHITVNLFEHFVLNNKDFNIDVPKLFTHRLKII